MNPSIRLLSQSDFPFADSLRARAEWNQTLNDWRRLLALQPDGCFVAEWNGEPAGTATTTVYGSDLAWIGMVLVNPELRRRGIGRALLDACLNYLGGKNVTCAKLDATPLGEKLYHEFGFVQEATLSRWTSSSISPRPPGAGAKSALVHPWNSGSWDLIKPLDLAVFGTSRQRILPSLADESILALAGKDGFGFLRAGARSLYLGPVVADTSTVATAVVDQLLADHPGSSVFWDIPDENVDAINLAKERGFERVRPLLRMRRGRQIPSGDFRRQFAIAGPELG